MSHNFQSGFTVRQPAWHGLGLVLDEYPGDWNEARRLAGLDWEPVEEPIYARRDVDGGVPIICNDEDPWSTYAERNPLEKLDGWQAVRRSDTGALLHIHRDSYGLFPNAELGPLVEALLDEDDVQYETAGVLDEGRKVWVMLRLKEPFEVPGDPRGLTLPRLALQNSHDGSTALRAQRLQTRIVCHAVGTPVLYKGEWIPVEDHTGVMTIKNEDGLHVHLVGLPEPETVTLDHKYWARLPGEGADWVMARDLTKDHQIGYPIPAGTDDDIVPEEFREDREDFWWAVGLFWGDGNLVGSRQICWSVSDPALEERLMSFLLRHGFKGKGTQRPGVRQITWSNQSLHDFVAPLYRGEGSGKGRRKKIPPQTWEDVSIEELSELVDGYYDADGSEDKSRGGRIWSSTCYEGLLSLRRMLMRLGRPSLIRISRKHYGTSQIQGREVYVSRSWTLRSPAGESVIEVEGGWVWSPITLVEWGGVNSFVPLDIPDDDHVYVTAFGQSHNCQNTSVAADREAQQHGHAFTFRHSTNIRERVEDAKAALAGLRDDRQAYVEWAHDLLSIPVTPIQKERWLSEFVPAPEVASDRVLANVEAARDQVRTILTSVTAEDTAHTAYGLVQGAIEYLDHVRPCRSDETRFSRSVRREPLKAKAEKLAREAASC